MSTGAAKFRRGNLQLVGRSQELGMVRAQTSQRLERPEERCMGQAGRVAPFESSQRMLFKVEPDARNAGLVCGNVRGKTNITMTEPRRP